MTFSFLKSFDTSVSLYIHIPFCHKKCSYCDFYSISNGNDYFSGILDGILDQIRMFFKRSGSPEISTVYIGGGTPSSLPLPVLDRFLSDLERLITDNVFEFTIEANPEDISPDFLKMLLDHRIDRLSMGIQSLDEKILKVLGRNTDRNITINALDCINLNWQRKKSFDMINCVPGQNTAGALRDIAEVISFNPDHISLYSLTFEEETPLTKLLNNGKFKQISENLGLDIYEKSIDFLEDSGFHRYEISNFSRQGKESFHNIRYWKMRPYFGAGPSAASTLPGHAGPLRLENPRNIDEFLKGEQLNWMISIEDIPVYSFLFEYLMMGFRLTLGIDTDGFKNIFNINFYSSFRRTLTLWAQRLVRNENFLALSREGLRFMDSFLADLVTELDDFSTISCNWP